MTIVLTDPIPHFLPPSFPFYPSSSLPPVPSLYPFSPSLYPFLLSLSSPSPSSLSPCPFLPLLPLFSLPLSLSVSPSLYVPFSSFSSSFSSFSSLLPFLLPFPPSFIAYRCFYSLCSELMEKSDYWNYASKCAWYQVRKLIHTLFNGSRQVGKKTSILLV